MRHRNGLRKLNRTSSHRQAMLRNMANCCSTRSHQDHLPKAKELRRVVEPLITLGKKPSLANRRLAFDRLRDREMVVKIFDELVRASARAMAGYLRILKCGFRDGDNAPMAFVELLDRPEVGPFETAAEEQSKKPANWLFFLQTRGCRGFKQVLPFRNSFFRPESLPVWRCQAVAVCALPRQDFRSPRRIWRRSAAPESLGFSSGPPAELLTLSFPSVAGSPGLVTNC